MNILFFDTETTGLPTNYKAPPTAIYNWPRLVELSWIVCNEAGEQLKAQTLVIRPNGFTIPESATEVHGITQDRAMQEGVMLSAALKAFMDDVKTADIIVAHNANYDINVIACELYRLSVLPLISKKAICTMQSSIVFCAIPSRNGYSKHKYPSLQELHTKLFGEGFEGEHSASVDTGVAQKCFFELVQQSVVTL